MRPLIPAEPASTMAKLVVTQHASPHLAGTAAGPRRGSCHGAPVCAGQSHARRGRHTILRPTPLAHAPTISLTPARGSTPFSVLEHEMRSLGTGYDLSTRAEGVSQTVLEQRRTQHPDTAAHNYHSPIRAPEKDKLVRAAKHTTASRSQGASCDPRQGPAKTVSTRDGAPMPHGPSCSCKRQEA